MNNLLDGATAYTASFIIFRDGNKVAFVMRRNTLWMDGYYGLIAGKVDAGESFTQAAVREAKEEAGVDLQPEDLRHVLTCHRKSDDGTYWVDTIFEAQTWQGELYNAEPDKHSSLDWLDIDNLPDTVIPVGGFYLEQIKAGNRFAEYGWKV